MGCKDWNNHSLKGPRPQIQGKIVGGTEKSISNHKYMVAMEVNGALNCGASIIGPTWAMSAAHCMEDYTGKKVTIRANTSTRENGGKVFDVMRTIVHPEFNKQNYNNDIALMEVKPAFLSVESELQSIALPSETSPIVPPGAEVTVLGWGNTHEDGELATGLQEVVLPIISEDECRYIYGDYIKHNMICAGYYKGGKDACQADSGGPMIFNDTVQVGIVSFGEGCARENTPGVYTNVRMMRSWIRDNTGI